jgi:hypothetical protein
MITIFENNGEWDLSKVVRDDNAIYQECLEILKLFLGDAYWDKPNGIDYLNYIGMDNNDVEIRNLLKADVVKHLYKVVGVELVENINVEIKEKKLLLMCDVITRNSTRFLQISI